jgi:hypothetical protein
MSLLRGGGDYHNHGIAAGLSAATAGVLIAGAGLWALWHRIAEQLGVAFLLAMWIMLMCGCAIAVAGVAWVWILLIGHARRTLRVPPATIPAPLTATAIPVPDYPAPLAPPTAPPLPNPIPMAELEAAAEHGDHYHFHGREAVEAAMRHLSQRDPQ